MLSTQSPKLSQTYRGTRPAEAAERIAEIDILRGLALAGVLAINLLNEFRISIFQQFVPSPPATHILDRWIETYIPVFVEMKAFALFSLLFGVGLAIQFDRAGVKGSALPFLSRRLLGLLLLGIIHLTLIWNGDILTEYAVAGFIALPFLFLPRLWVGVPALLFAARYALLPYDPIPVHFPTTSWLQAHLVQAAIVYKDGTFPQILRFELHELPALLPLHIAVMPRTIALFLFGAFCWRLGLLKQLKRNTLKLGIAALVCLSIGLTLTILTSELVASPLPGKSGATAQLVGEMMLAIGYASAILWVTAKHLGLRLLRWAAPMGRMAFTNYVLQSILFSFIFFGWGLGQFGMRATPALLIGIAVYVLQVWGSAVWLRHYRFGPVEWLWRTMTYGAMQPMRR